MGAMHAFSAVLPEAAIEAVPPRMGEIGRLATLPASGCWLAGEIGNRAGVGGIGNQSDARRAIAGRREVLDLSPAGASTCLTARRRRACGCARCPTGSLVCIAARPRCRRRPSRLRWARAPPAGRCGAPASSRPSSSSVRPTRARVGVDNKINAERAGGRAHCDASACGRCLF